MQREARRRLRREERQAAHSNGRRFERFGRIDDATFGEEMSSWPRSFRRLRLLIQSTPSRGDGSGNRMLLVW
jgi:hypothetical protein